MERHFAIGVGGEVDADQGVALLDVVVDFGIGHQGGTVGFIQRLAAGLQIDDGETALDHGETTGLETPRSVGPAMSQGGVKGIEHGLVRRRAADAHVTGDATHQAATFAKKSR